MHTRHLTVHFQIEDNDETCVFQLSVHSMRYLMEKLGTQPTDFKVMDIVLFCIFGIISFPCTAATTNCYVEEGKAYRGPPNQSFRNVESYESCRSLCSFGPDIPYFVWRGPNSPNPNSRLDCNCKMNRDTIEDVGGIYSGNTKCTNGKLLTSSD